MPRPFGPLLTIVLASSLGVALSAAGTTAGEAGETGAAVIRRVSDLPVPLGPRRAVEIRVADEFVQTSPINGLRTPASIRVSDESLAPVKLGLGLPSAETLPPVPAIKVPAAKSPIRKVPVANLLPAADVAESLPLEGLPPVPAAVAEQTLTVAYGLPVPESVQQAPSAPEPPLAPAEVLPVPAPQDPAIPQPELLPGDRPIGSVTTAITPPAGALPPNAAEDHFSEELAAIVPRPWAGSVYFWDAPALCYRPLRYEEINLERYGYTNHPVLQPVLSGGHFFVATLGLPYDMTLHPRDECIYTLGHYRPGSPVPFQHHWPEWDAKAALVEGGVVTGLFFLIP